MIILYFTLLYIIRNITIYNNYALLHKCPAGRTFSATGLPVSPSAHQIQSPHNWTPRIIYLFISIYIIYFNFSHLIYLLYLFWLIIISIISTTYYCIYLLIYFFIHSFIHLSFIYNLYLFIDIYRFLLIFICLFIYYVSISFLLLI